MLTVSGEKSVQSYCEYIEGMVAKGGPEASEYDDLDAWGLMLQSDIYINQISEDGIQKIRRSLGPVLSFSTIHGFAYLKPHGYAGDFELIDRIYNNHTSKDKNLFRWDLYCNRHPTLNAVKNRKEYFKALIFKNKNNIHNVFNLGSGPGRDIYELLNTMECSDIRFVCIDQDDNALQHAANLCKPHIDNIEFRRADILKYKTDEKFDLIFAGGVFDYFSDEIFVLMLKKLCKMTRNGGRIVIGNFSWNNPGRGWMTICEWHLFYRSLEHLKTLAVSAGINKCAISIECESNAINYFLNIAL
jgi:extracellular factor (EF) 3-hydroxypalmitic acid methyl ester biosynthesis protein